MLKRIVALCFLFPLLIGPQRLLSADWPQWRGPQFNGSCDASNLPTDWSRTENVVWARELPGPAESTPIVAGNRIYVSSTLPAENLLLALCLDRATGEVLWRYTVSDTLRKDSRSTFAGPSPATDGRHVVFFYGTGELVTYDIDGNELWRRNIQEDYGGFAFGWTFSTSPLLYGGKLYMQVLQRDVAVDGRGFTDRPNESYILALDPATGKELFRARRPSQAKMESREAFTTPIPFEHAGRKEILVVGGDDLTGHDPDTGRELWRWGTWNPTRIGHWRLVPSPVAGGGSILACAPKKDPIYAVKAGGNGLLNDQALAWVSRDERAISSDVPTPAFYDGDFLVLSDVRKYLSRVDPATGAIKWSTRTPGLSKYEASPLAADGKIYLINFAGEVSIIDAESGKVLNIIDMSDPAHPFDGFNVRSSIIASDHQLFVRTNSHLYCIAK